MSLCSELIQRSLQYVPVRRKKISQRIGQRDGVLSTGKRTHAVTLGNTGTPHEAMTGQEACRGIIAGSVSEEVEQRLDIEQQPSPAPETMADQEEYNTTGRITSKYNSCGINKSDCVCSYQEQGREGSMLCGD